MCSPCSALAGTQDVALVSRLANQQQQTGCTGQGRVCGPATTSQKTGCTSEGRACEPAQHCAKNNLLVRESCRPKGGPFAFFEATARELDQELEERLSDQTGNDFHLADHDFKCPSKHKTLRLAQRAPCLSWRAVWELSRAPIPSPAGLGLARPLHV